MVTEGWQEEYLEATWTEESAATLDLSKHIKFMEMVREGKAIRARKRRLRWAYLGLLGVFGLFVVLILINN